MKLTELFLEELDREAVRTRPALERVPTGRDDWKPHPKSMPLARLAGLVATMPSWISLVIKKLPRTGRRSPNGEQLAVRSDVCFNAARLGQSGRSPTARNSWSPA